MKIAIAGATGFLGRSLSSALEAKGYTVLKLSRKMFDEASRDQLAEAISSSDVVINLAGRSLLGRWTRRHKEEVFRSRVETTRTLVEAINYSITPPKLFISASATGYYSSSKIYSEHDARGGGNYLSWLCEQWETAARQVIPQVRLAIIRISPVLAREGGMLGPLFRALGLRVSLRVGSPSNCFSWIHIDDFVSAILFVIADASIAGTVNLTAPGITTNDYMAAMLSDIMDARVKIRIPTPLLNIALGDSRHLISSSKAIYPAVLLEHGFKFRYPYIRAALKNIAEN